MEKFEYFGGIPEIGIVPRAPHAGPLVRHVYEQEHGRGGFAGKVTHTYHLYPPNNWLPDETRVLDRRTWAPDWESPLTPLGGVLQPGSQSSWVYESFAGDPEKSEAPTTGQFITHSRSDYKFPRTLDTRNEAGRFEVVSKVAEVYTRRVHPTHPFDVVGWRGDYLPYKFAVEDVRPLVADRSHVPPSGHTIFKLPGCYICVFTVRSVEKEGMWLPFFHRNLDYLETIGYHFGNFFSGGGVVTEGMVTLHPVGLPHGPKPAALKAFLDSRNPRVHHEVAIMADLANPTQISEFALSLSKPDYMRSWVDYTTDPRFTHRPDRLPQVRALAERYADARDELRPQDPAPE